MCVVCDIHHQLTWSWLCVLCVTYTINCYSVLCLTVAERMKPISVESFRDHVNEMHEERDKGFETEYQVMLLSSIL